MHQRNAQEIDDSPDTSFQLLDAEKSNLIEEQVAVITQQIDSRIARKLKDQNQIAENINLEALCSQSENSLRWVVISVDDQVTLEQENVSLGQFNSPGFKWHPETFNPEDSYADVQPEFFEMVTGLPEKYLLKKRIPTPQNNQHEQINSSQTPKYSFQPNHYWN